MACPGPSIQKCVRGGRIINRCVLWPEPVQRQGTQCRTSAHGGVRHSARTKRSCLSASTLGSRRIQTLPCRTQRRMRQDAGPLARHSIVLARHGGSNRTGLPVPLRHGGKPLGQVLRPAGGNASSEAQQWGRVGHKVRDPPKCRTGGRGVSTPPKHPYKRWGRLGHAPGGERPKSWTKLEVINASPRAAERGELEGRHSVPGNEQRR
jgi:hypothetical protein